MSFRAMGSEESLHMQVVVTPLFFLGDYFRYSLLDGFISGGIAPSPNPFIQVLRELASIGSCRR